MVPEICKYILQVSGTFLFFQQKGEKIMHVLKEMNTEREPEFVRDAEGAKLARMGVNTFRKLAEEFDAV